MADTVTAEQPTTQPSPEPTPAPAPVPAAAAPSTPGPAAIPGVPLAVAGANVLGLVAAGAVEVAGTAGLAATAAAGLTAAGAAGVRAVRRRKGRRSAGLSARATTAAAVRRAAGGVSAPVPAPRSSGISTGKTAPRGGHARPPAAGLRPAAAGRTSGTASMAGTGTGPSRTGRVPAPGGVAGRSAAVGGQHRAGAAAGPRKPKVSLVKGSAVKPGPASPKGAASKNTPGAVRRLARAAANRLQAGAQSRAVKAAERTARRTANGEAKARKDTAPATASAAGSKAQKRALLRSALRHRARLAASGLLAGAVGALSGLWNAKRPGVAAGHMRAVWRRLSDAARAARARRDAAITGKATPDHTPAPETAVDDPTRPEKPEPAAPNRGKATLRPVPLRTTREGATAVSTPAFTRLSEAMEAAVAAATSFDPERMEEFQALIDDLPVAAQQFGDMVRTLAELSAERLPVERVVVDAIADGYRAMGHVVEVLGDVGVIYRRAHAEDLERIDSPRNGVEAERKWNV